MSELNITLPDIDDEVALEIAEDQANLQADAAAGKIDTINFQEIDDGTYPATIVDCQVKGSKNKAGEATFPNVVFRIKADNGAFVTSVYWPVSGAKQKARQFFARRLLTTFMRLLGPSFNEVVAPNVTDLSPKEVLAATCVYYHKLAQMCIGKAINFKVERGTEGAGEGYNNATISPLSK